MDTNVYKYEPFLSKTNLNPNCLCILAHFTVYLKMTDVILSTLQITMWLNCKIAVV